jgi:hypothetical protein
MSAAGFHPSRRAGHQACGSDRQRDGPEQTGSGQRPATLMQDRLPPAGQTRLQRTAGPYIGISRVDRARPWPVGFAPASGHIAATQRYRRDGPLLDILRPVYINTSPTNPYLAQAHTRGPPLPVAAVTTFCRARICEPGRSSHQRKPVTGCGCITLFTM